MPRASTESFDAGLVAGAELDDLDEKVIADYRAAAPKPTRMLRNFAGLTWSCCRR